MPPDPSTPSLTLVIHAYTSYTHITPFAKILATGLYDVNFPTMFICSSSEMKLAQIIL